MTTTGSKKEILNPKNCAKDGNGPTPQYIQRNKIIDKVIGKIVFEKCEKI